MATGAGVSPPGWEQAVAKLQAEAVSDDVVALAWWMQHAGYDAGAMCDDDQARAAACERYKEACKAGAVPDTVTLAAAGEAWAQAVCLGQRWGTPFHVYREPR